MFLKKKKIDVGLHIAHACESQTGYQRVEVFAPGLPSPSLDALRNIVKSGSQLSSDILLSVPASL